jgi:hypothetical protein
MDNFSRRYYERELGAGIAPSPSMRESFGYTEPFRRFVQRENFSPQANPLRNEMPSWLPGANYLTNFHIGDPFVKVDEGYARLPGAGYEALHPELKGLNPEDYPDINKLAILADVAPYSREYNIFRSKVGNDSADNTELRIEYEKILDRVRQTRESVIRMDNQVSPSCQPKNASRGRGKSPQSSPAHFGPAASRPRLSLAHPLRTVELPPGRHTRSLAFASLPAVCSSRSASLWLSLFGLHACRMAVFQGLVPKWELALRYSSNAPRARDRLSARRGWGQPLSPTCHWNFWSDRHEIYR